MLDRETKLRAAVKTAFRKFPPEQHGGCFVATRWLVKELPWLRERVIEVDTGRQPMRHCVAVTPDGRIVDTQLWQFGLVMPIPIERVRQGIYTEEEHEAILPRVHQ